MFVSTESILKILVGRDDGSFRIDERRCAKFISDGAQWYTLCLELTIEKMKFTHQIPAVRLDFRPVQANTAGLSGHRLQACKR